MHRNAKLMIKRSTVCVRTLKNLINNAPLQPRTTLRSSRRIELGMSRWRIYPSVLVLIGIALIVGGCGGVSPRNSASTSELAIDVKIVGNDNMVIKLRNVSNKPLTMSKASLPWEWRYSFWVKAFINDASGSPL